MFSFNSGQRYLKYFTNSPVIIIAATVLNWWASKSRLKKQDVFCLLPLGLAVKAIPMHSIENKNGTAEPGVTAAELLKWEIVLPGLSSIIISPYLLIYSHWGWEEKKLLEAGLPSISSRTLGGEGSLACTGRAKNLHFIKLRHRAGCSAFKHKWRLNWWRALVAQIW